jgi:hypothetical protein
MKMIGKSQTTVQRPLAYLLSWLEQIIVFAKDGSSILEQRLKNRLTTQEK